LQLNFLNISPKFHARCLNNVNVIANCWISLDRLS